MSKRLWLNLILLVVGGVLIYFIGYQPKQGQQSKDLPVTLFTIAPYQAVNIHIERAGKFDVIFKKIEDQWRLVKPGIAPVNSNKVKHLLTILQEPIVASYDPEGKDLSQFGLSPGKIKLTINAEEATFGSTNPVTLNRYILKNNKIFTLQEIVYGVLGTSVTPFLTHHLLPKQGKVEVISAPKIFSETTVDFWQTVEARDISDYVDTETIIGKVVLKLFSSETNDSVEIITFDILAIKPSLILVRSDLKVKYTFDEDIINKN